MGKTLEDTLEEMRNEFPLKGKSCVYTVWIDTRDDCTAVFGSGNLVGFPNATFDEIKPYLIEINRHTPITAFIVDNKKTYRVESMITFAEKQCEV